MRKTKRLRKISKFTNKNKLGGMLSTKITGSDERHAFRILGEINSLLIGTDTQNMEIIKSDIVSMIDKFKKLNTKDKIAFVELVSAEFNKFHHRSPILIELYYMQIMILIDATLHINWLKPRTAYLAKLSNDTMQMIAKKFATNAVTPVKSLSSGMPVQRSRTAQLDSTLNSKVQVL